MGRRYVALGTDGFGRSDFRRKLRGFFEVDRRFVAVDRERGIVFAFAFFDHQNINWTWQLGELFKIEKGKIRRIEAKGGVTVVQKDQHASGDTATFNMRENTVTLTGNVVVTRGQDILRGQRLVVDLTSGITRMDQGRVEGLFQARNPEKK